MEKSQRKKKVMDIILKMHIDTAEPVGSKYVSNILGISSATVRNVMAEIEEEGYIEQPHTSAGRIPTELAYRMYVNTLLLEREKIAGEIRVLEDELFSKYRKYSDIIERISYAVSKLTGYTSFGIYPKDHMYMDGACHMLEQPEFENVNTVRKILKALDEREKLLETMNSYLDSGVLKINIGHENRIDGFETCTIITSSYKVNKKVVGGVGIIGPIRMNYRHVVPVVKHFSEAVSRLLEKMYE